MHQVESFARLQEVENALLHSTSPHKDHERLHFYIALQKTNADPRRSSTTLLDQHYGITADSQAALESPVGASWLRGNAVGLAIGARRGSRGNRSLSKHET